jgi:hypothetical protein
VWIGGLFGYGLDFRHRGGEFGVFHIDLIDDC